MTFMEIEIRESVKILSKYTSIQIYHGYYDIIIIV